YGYPTSRNKDQKKHTTNKELHENNPRNLMLCYLEEHMLDHTSINEIIEIALSNFLWAQTKFMTDKALRYPSS
ncbi:hypothetical protein E2562_022424, partial [Oryza meyeriana var. granulata]